MEAPTENQAVQFEQFIEEAKKHHAEAMANAGETLKAAQLCGQALVKARDVAGHGHWLKTLKRFWPELSRSTAYNYISLADNSKLLGNLTATEEAYRRLGIMPTAPADTETVSSGKASIFTVQSIERWGTRIQERTPDVLAWPEEEKAKLKEALRPMADLYNALAGEKVAVEV